MKEILKKINKIIKKIKLKNLISLICIFAFNTYAWFIYTTKVSTDLTAHVSAWNVDFVAKERRSRISNINRS